MNDSRAGESVYRLGSGEYRQNGLVQRKKTRRSSDGCSCDRRVRHNSELRARPVWCPEWIKRRLQWRFVGRFQRWIGWRIRHRPEHLRRFKWRKLRWIIGRFVWWQFRWIIGRFVWWIIRWIRSSGTGWILGCVRSTRCTSTGL